MKHVISTRNTKFAKFCDRVEGFIMAPLADTLRLMADYLLPFAEQMGFRFELLYKYKIEQFRRKESFLYFSMIRKYSSGLLTV